jgi:hypothetical protein
MINIAYLGELYTGKVDKELEEKARQENHISGHVLYIDEMYFILSKEQLEEIEKMFPINLIKPYELN